MWLYNPILYALFMFIYYITIPLIYTLTRILEIIRKTFNFTFIGHTLLYGGYEQPSDFDSTNNQLGRLLSNPRLAFIGLPSVFWIVIGLIVVASFGIFLFGFIKSLASSGADGDNTYTKKVSLFIKGTSIAIILPVAIYVLIIVSSLILTVWENEFLPNLLSSLSRNSEKTSSSIVQNIVTQLAPPWTPKNNNTWGNILEASWGWEPNYHWYEKKDAEWYYYAPWGSSFLWNIFTTAIIVQLFWLSMYITLKVVASTIIIFIKLFTVPLAILIINVDNGKQLREEIKSLVSEVMVVFMAGAVITLFGTVVILTSKMADENFKDALSKNGGGSAFVIYLRDNLIKLIVSLGASTLCKKLIDKFGTKSVKEGVSRIIGAATMATGGIGALAASQAASGVSGSTNSVANALKNNFDNNNTRNSFNNALNNSKQNSSHQIKDELRQRKAAITSKYKNTYNNLIQSGKITIDRVAPRNKG